MIRKSRLTGVSGAAVTLAALALVVGGMAPAASAVDGGITVSSTDMSNNMPLNPLFACDAAPSPPAPASGFVSPQLSWSAGPTGTMSYIVLMHDETTVGDAAYASPSDWAHWTAYNVGAATTSLDRDASAASALGGGTEAVNTWGEFGMPGEDRYRGPCPPDGTTHNYVFTVYALSATITPVATGFGGTVTTQDVLDAATGLILDQGDLAVTFATSAVGTDRADIELSGDASAAEAVGGGFPSLLVNGVVAVPTTVTVTLTGTATNGVDYSPASPIVVTIPAATYDGTAATAVPIPGLAVIDDTTDEPDETVVLTLSTGDDNVSLTDANHDGVNVQTATYTIVDDDLPVVVPPAGVVVELEGNVSSTETTAAAFPRLLVEGTVVAPTTVTVTATGTATAGTDYQPAGPYVVTIPAGTYDGTPATAIAIPGLTVINDTADEPDEAVVLTLSAPTGDATLGDADMNGVSVQTSTYTIVDDDVAAVVPPVTPPTTPPTTPGSPAAAPPQLAVTGADATPAFTVGALATLMGLAALGVARVRSRGTADRRS